MTVPVRLNTTSYGWVFRFVFKMSIRISEHIREACAGIRRMQMMTRRESKKSEHTKSCKRG